MRKKIVSSRKDHVAESFHSMPSGIAVNAAVAAATAASFAATLVDKQQRREKETTGATASNQHFSQLKMQQTDKFVADLLVRQSKRGI